MPKNTQNVKKSDQNKPWNKHKQLSKIPLETRAKGTKYLIVCEGQTEKLYFDRFPVATASVVSVGVGMTHYRLVEEAQKLMKQDKYDEVWCVFDMDLNTERNGQLEDFNKAVFADNGVNFRCAYSNDAFELWIYLHFQATEHQYLRHFYYEKLSDFWGKNYEREGKKQEFSKTIYSKLENDPNASQANAIQRAKELFAKNKDVTNPHARNPITTVYDLVEKLNAHAKK